MRKRNPGATTNSTRQLGVNQQQMTSQVQSQQPGYGYPQRMQQQQQQQQIYQQPVNQGFPPGFQQGQPRPPMQTTVEQKDGNPPIIHYGKIQMKDAITLITLRLAKLEELTSSPTFNAVMDGGSLSGDITTDITTEIIDNISERLNNLETNISVLIQEMNTLKSSIDTIITQTSFDEDQQLMLAPHWTNVPKDSITPDTLVSAPTTPTTTEPINDENGE